MEKERDSWDLIREKFDEFYSSFDMVDPKIVADILSMKEKFIYKEIEDHKSIIEELVEKTLKMNLLLCKQKPKLAPKFSLVPNIMKEKLVINNSQNKLERMKTQSLAASSQRSNDISDEDTSVDSLRESERVRISQFIDKNEKADLWKHEASFRRKTVKRITTALEKKKTENRNIEDILPQIGNFMSKAAHTMNNIERKSQMAGADVFLQAVRETSRTSDRSAQKPFTILTPG